MLTRLKNNISSIPVVGPILRWVYQKSTGRKAIEFRRSDQYWEDRYRLGGTSGSGSYGRLARFKAQYLNDFVTKNEIKTIAEFGCGDGAQLELASYPSYIGFDVAPTSIELCRERFSDSLGFSFHLVASEEFRTLEPVDLALSLDVIYHLIEDDVFEFYMENLFRSSKHFVIIYAYDFEKYYSAKHEKGRNFTNWIRKNALDWKLIEQAPNKYPYDPANPNETSQSDFFIYKKGL